MAKKWKPPHVPDLKVVLKKARDISRHEGLIALEEYAEGQRELFVQKIEHQTFASFKVILYPESGTNLSPEWLDRKEAAGADDRTMIATRHYIENIKVFRKGRPQRGPVEFRIGFHQSAKARDLKNRVSQILLRDLARVHEFGSIKANIPARPHWGPHANTMRKGAKKVRMTINVRIGKRLKKALPKHASMI